MLGRIGLERKVRTFLERLLALPRNARRMFVMLIDMAACLTATWAGFSIRLGVTRVELEDYAVITVLALASWLLAAMIVHPYRSTVRYTGRRTIFLIGQSCLMMMAILAFVLFLTVPEGIPRTLGILVPILFFCFIATSRVFIASVLQPIVETKNSGVRSKRVVIYGTGAAMNQMALSVNREPGLQLVGIVDYRDAQNGALLEGVPIVGDHKLKETIVDGEVDELILANAERGQRSIRLKLLEKLRKSEMRIPVRVLPSIADVAFDKVSVSDLRKVEIGDLLGRDPVAPDPQLISRNIADCTVMVTGAGGSIGSELARQILTHSPKRLILVDQSEYHLYAIDAELRALAEERGIATMIEPDLANVADAGDCARLFDTARPNTVFHAAAYKHVPLVERNVTSGVRNNVMGTLNTALEAEKHGTETFILVSTDKAVRPTSVMGASKRVCELVVQARASSGAQTCYSAVRFGNVLGSSGSVVPKFREQIVKGGPVTVTHRDMTRFFMTIPEASQLVIQAGAMAQGGEVYLLDMGEPVKISGLARAMIELSGLEVRDENNPEGDIEIVEVGLRPGEKLFEELLIGNDPQPTQHPRIVKGHEDQLEWSVLDAKLQALASAINEDDHDAVRALLSDLVPEYKPVAAALVD